MTKPTTQKKTIIIDQWFPPEMVERFKIVDTPYQIDLGYKRGLIEQLPATKEDLAALKKK